MNSQLPATTVADKCVMIVAGEASGDIHGANLIRSMREKAGGFFFCGIGGRAMQEAGARLIVDADQLAVVGITEVFAKLPVILKSMAAAKRMVRSQIPNLLILIDFPDFNLRLATAAKKAGIPVFYYITPQVWAWRKRRVHAIRRLVDHAAVIFPFEVDFFREHNVPVTFVGHPLLDAGYHQEMIAGAQPSAEEQPVIGLLPGSRSREVRSHLPVMLAAAERIRQQIKTAKFIVSCAPSVPREEFTTICQAYHDRLTVELVSDRVITIFEKSTLVVAVSGTVTLEAALSETPMLIVYRVSKMSYWLARALIRLQNISLVNLVAEQEIVPELLQSEASPSKIAEEICDLLNNPDRLEAMRTGLREVRRRLGGSGASANAADIAISLL